MHMHRAAPREGAPPAPTPAADCYAPLLRRRAEPAGKDAQIELLVAYPLPVLASEDAMPRSRGKRNGDERAMGFGKRRRVRTMQSVSPQRCLSAKDRDSDIAVRLGPLATSHGRPQVMPLAGHTDPAYAERREDH